LLYDEKFTSILKFWNISDTQITQKCCTRENNIRYNYYLISRSHFTGWWRISGSTELSVSAFLHVLIHSSTRYNVQGVTIIGPAWAVIIITGIYILTYIYIYEYALKGFVINGHRMWIYIKSDYSGPNKMLFLINLFTSLQ